MADNTSVVYLGQSRSSLIQILQRTQAYLAVGLLGLGKQVTQQNGKNIEGIVLGARFQTMNERNQGGGAPCDR